MSDKFSREVRSKIMKSIRSKDTSPEKLVRSYLHRAGLRFRLHKTGLPGSPDIVLPKHKTVVFVHGCFWHHHQSPDCPYSKKPKSNLDYWLPKLERTMERDRENLRELNSLGWKVGVVWECEIGEKQLQKLVEFIKNGQ